MRVDRYILNTVNILNDKYPDIAKEIANILDTIPAAEIQDFSQMSSIVDRFITVSNISSVDWIKSCQVISSNIVEEYRPLKVTEIRQFLIAVILKFYQPEKMSNVIQVHTKVGLLKELSLITKCDKATLSLCLSNAVTYYGVYKQFRQHVDKIYDAIKLELLEPVNLLAT